MKISNLSAQNKRLDPRDEFGIDVLTGLSALPKSISAKYFYDDKGSELFQRISQEPDYYLTNKEFSILQAMAPHLPGLVGAPGSAPSAIDIVELGAGDGHKSKLLIDGFLKQGTKVNYYPVDISEEAMRLLEKNITASAQLAVTGIVADYFSGLSHVRSLSKNRQIVLFLGSNLGNFDRTQSLQFLRKLWKSLNADDLLLIGFDQKKNIHALNRAYNDASGYTTQFNLNLLTRMNRELGANFLVDQFQHYGFYNPCQGAMESYLISLQEQTVYIAELQKSFHFGRYEPVHLEYSFKFLPADIDFLCRQTGFSPIRNFTDEQEYFIDALWTVSKGP